MTYRILMAEHALELAKLVNAAILDGWKPLGGVAVVQNPSFLQRVDFYQAMVNE